MPAQRGAAPAGGMYQHLGSAMRASVLSYAPAPFSMVRAKP